MINSGGELSKRWVGFLTNPLTVLLAAVALFVLTELIATLLYTANGLRLQGASTTQLFIYSLLKLTVFVGLLYLARLTLRFSWGSIGFRRPSWRAVFAVLPVFAVYVVLSGLLVIVATRLIPGFDTKQTQDLAFNYTQQGYELFATLLMLVFVTPFIEEVLFRGVLFYGFRRKLPFWVSSIVVSLVFAAAHGQWNVAVDTFALSLMLCWLTERSKSILPAILLHAVKNAVAFTLLFIIKVN